MKNLFLAILLVAVNASGVSVAGRQADLDFIANQLPSLHANFFYQLDPADYRQAVANVQANIATLTDAEFYVSLGRW